MENAIKLRKDTQCHLCQFVQLLACTSVHFPFTIAAYVIFYYSVSSKLLKPNRLGFITRYSSLFNKRFSGKSSGGLFTPNNDSV